MGTRAAFWIGDPADLDNREWLGCVAFDGYPSNYEHLAEAKSAEEFRTLIDNVKAKEHHFADPKAGGWPFPWVNDVFLTDCTYVFFDGQVQFCEFHEPFVPLFQYLKRDHDDDDEKEVGDDPRHESVPAPAQYDQSQPDSIMIITTARQQ